MRILDFLFPPKCVFCGGILAQGEQFVCSRCMDEVNVDAHERGGEFFIKAVSALSFEGRARHAMHRFKYSGRQSYAVPLAMLVDFAIRQKLDKPFDCIAAVPTTRKNLRLRGYNHAELLGRELSKLCAVPYVNALEKCRETNPMHGMNASERRANVLGSVRLACKRDEIAGKTVLVVDDIMTTGATFSECSRVLLAGGAESIVCAAVAAVLHEPEKLKK